MRYKTILKLLVFFLISSSKCLFCQILAQNSQHLSVTDHEFDNGSKILSIPLTSEKIENLRLLGKIWGFLKYYHPQVAQGKYNWDYELFRILPKVINAKTTQERNHVFLSWINKLGPIKRGTKEVLDSVRVKLYPDIAWISENKTLGSKLCLELEKIKSAKRPENNYYISLIPNVQNPDFSHENEYIQTPFPDTGYRLLALYRYWNIIEYYNPNKHLIKKNWDSVLCEFIPQFISDSTALQYKLSVLSLISCISDTHADLYGDPDIENFKGKYMAPYRIAFIENKPVIIDRMQENDSDSALHNGDIILKIDSVNIETIISQKLLYTSGSNYPAQLRKIASDLLRTNKSVLNVTYQRDSLIKNVNISINRTKISIDNYFKNKQPDSSYRIITPKIGYIYPGNIKAIYIDQIMAKLLNTKGIIIDLRYYPAESIIHKFGEYIYPKPVIFEISSTGSITTPGLFMLKKQPNRVGGNKTNVLYHGKVILLVNEYTQSHGEFTAMAFSQYNQTTTIGSTTAGADGNVSRFYLPGGIMTLISGIGVYYPDGRETQRVGVSIDINISPTINGIKDGRDELLEKAVDLLNTQ